MAGKHTLSENNVERLVDEDRIGVYMLYNSREGPPRYVGRSTELASRLLDYVGEYKLFWADYMPNVTEAYKKEVELYHHNGAKADLDNDRHPRRPHKNVKCKLCDVHE